jgi:hypothetical protein
MHTPVNQKDLKALLNHLRSSAKKRKIPFDLTLVDLNNLSFPVSCPILGIPLYFHRNKMQEDSYSIDRINSQLGYTIDNLMVISNRANRIKNNATDEELSKLAKFTF